MIKETDGDSFEAMRCLDQELTFEAAKKEFQLRNVDFGSAKMRTLKLVDRDDLYTNLACCSFQINAVTRSKRRSLQGTDADRL